VEQNPVLEADSRLAISRPHKEIPWMVQTTALRVSDILPAVLFPNIIVTYWSSASGLVTHCHKCTRPSNLGKRRPKPIYRDVEPWLLLLLLLLEQY
jgi:hypothetical protein